MKIGNFEIRLPSISRVQQQEKGGTSQLRPGNPVNTGTYSSSYKASQEIAIFKFIRNQLSFLDATVLKRTLLIGDYDVYGEDKATTEFLNNYKKMVKENFFFRGQSNFIHQMADSTYATGVGLGEKILKEDLSGTEMLLNGDPKHIRFIPDEEKGYILGYQSDGMMSPKPFENQELIYYSAFDRRYGNPKGYSLFYSLEFATQLMTRIMQSLHNTTWRIGDPTFVAITKGNKSEVAGPKKISKDIATQLTEVAKDRSRGRVRDIHAYTPDGYDIEISALGVDGVPAFDFTENSRIVIEQLIAKSHLPPYSFGFYQWNSNFRMSSDQQKMLLAAVKDDRGMLTPIIERDLGLELFYAGRRKKFWIEWHDIDLTEISDKARANHLNAAANKANADTQLNLWLNAVISDQELREALVGYNVIQENQDSQKSFNQLERLRELFLVGKISQQMFREKSQLIIKE